MPAVMNALQLYFDEVENALALAPKVGCAHTTLYRIAAGAQRARRGLAGRIEAATGGRVTRAMLSAIADQGEGLATGSGSANGVAVTSGEPAQESVQADSGGEAGHAGKVSPADADRHREPFSPREAQS